MGKVIELNTKDWGIYNTIKERSLNNDWTSVGYLAEMYQCSKRIVRKHIQKIRESNVIQKIIITDYGKGYKLMSDEDEFELLTKTKIKILKQLKRYWKDVERYNLNHQNKITFSKTERDIYESLIEVNENVES